MKISMEFLAPSCKIKQNANRQGNAKNINNCGAYENYHH